jgi:flagellar basal-body rod protein FlgC
MWVISENIGARIPRGAAAAFIAAKSCDPPRTPLVRGEGEASRARQGQADSSAFRVKHEPSNPAADTAGNVKYPNVNPLIEMTDMRDAQRSYEANLNIISATRRMIQRTLDILKA